MARAKTNGHSIVDTPPTADGQRVQRELKCKLTQDELLIRGDQMAEAELEVDELKDTRRGVNGQIADLVDRRSKLAKAIEAQEEDRMVDCVWSADKRHNVWRLKRTDVKPHEEIATRTMSVAELQEPLFAPDADGGDDETAEAAAEAKLKPKPKRASAKAAKAKGNTRHAHA